VGVGARDEGGERARVWGQARRWRWRWEGEAIRGGGGRRRWRWPEIGGGRGVAKRSEASESSRNRTHESNSNSKQHHRGVARFVRGGSSRAERAWTVDRGGVEWRGLVGYITRTWAGGWNCPLTGGPCQDFSFRKNTQYPDKRMQKLHTY
jgi:hypothetical protein